MNLRSPRVDGCSRILCARTAVSGEDLPAVRVRRRYLLEEDHAKGDGQRTAIIMPLTLRKRGRRCAAFFRAPLISSLYQLISAARDGDDGGAPPLLPLAAAEGAPPCEPLPPPCDLIAASSPTAPPPPPAPERPPAGGIAGGGANAALGSKTRWWGSSPRMAAVVCGHEGCVRSEILDSDGRT